MSRCEIEIVYPDVNETAVKMKNIHRVVWLDEMKDETDCQDAKRIWYTAMSIAACIYEKGLNFIYSVYVWIWND